MKKWIRDAGTPLNMGYVGPADGIRVLAVFIVSWFHIWQQSWLYPMYTIGPWQLNFEPLVRSGYIWVDMMILLSGFCLYLPWTRLKSGDRDPGIWQFYKKRIARIVPSYIFCVLVMLAVALKKDVYDGSGDFLWRDLLTHLTMTQMFRMDTYYFTNLNAALWTLCLEAQLYLLFPFIARGMRRHPVLTAVPLILFGNISRALLIGWGGDVSLYFNQLPCYIDVFVLGMIAARLYACLSQVRRPWLTVLYSVGTVLFLWGLFELCRLQSANPDTAEIRLGQLQNRPMMALLGAGLLLCACNAGLGMRTLFGNRLVHFLAGISMQYYIWHQVLAVWISESRIIPSPFENPNYMGDYLWQQRFSLAAFLGAAAVAIVLTYGLERPMSRLILKERKKNA